MIILVGFPKSGTSSFQKLITELGYNSYHFSRVKMNILEKWYTKIRNE